MLLPPTPFASQVDITKIDNGGGAKDEKEAELQVIMETAAAAILDL